MYYIIKQNIKKGFVEVVGSKVKNKKTRKCIFLDRHETEN